MNKKIFINIKAVDGLGYYIEGEDRGTYYSVTLREGPGFNGFIKSIDISYSRTGLGDLPIRRVFFSFESCLSYAIKTLQGQLPKIIKSKESAKLAIEKVYQGHIRNRY